MDIVITIPSSTDWNEYKKELDAAENDGQILNYKVTAFPKHAGVGSKCYVVHKGYIRGYQIISGFSVQDFQCTTTGKYWAGKFIQRSGKFYKLDKQIACTGFRGFRYFDDVTHRPYIPLPILKPIYGKRID